MVISYSNAVTVQDPVNQFPDLGGHFSGYRLMVVVVAWRRARSLSGECPPPPGFGWDLRVKLPSSVLSPCSPPSCSAPLPLFGSTRGAKHGGEGNAKLHEREWMTERTREIDIRKTPGAPSLSRPFWTPAGGPVWRWHPSIYPPSGVGRRRGRRPRWNGCAAFPRTHSGSTKRTSAPVNCPPRRPLTEFMRPPLCKVSRLLWRLRCGVGRADRSAPVIDSVYERILLPSTFRGAHNYVNVDARRTNSILQKSCFFVNSIYDKIVLLRELDQ